MAPYFGFVLDRKHRVLILGARRYFFSFNFLMKPSEITKILNIMDFFLSAWHSESMRDNIDDNFDIVFPERINKGRTKRDLSTGSKVFDPLVSVRTINVLNLQ